MPMVGYSYSQAIPENKAKVAYRSDFGIYRLEFVAINALLPVSNSKKR